MQKRLVRIANAILDLEPYKPDNVYSPHDRNREGFLKLDRNEATIGPSPKAVEIIRDFIAQKPLNWYPDSEAVELRRKLSEYVRQPQECIGCYAGESLAVENILRTYLEVGTELLIDGPSPHNVIISALSTGARVNEVKHGDPTNPRIENIVNMISPRTRAVYIGNPNDLSGGYYSEAELVFLLAYAERTMIIVDEQYHEYIRRSMADLVSRFQNLTVVRSFSRAFGLASLKAAYIVSDAENLRFIERIKGDNGPDSVSQIAAMAVLDNFDYSREYVAGIEQSKKMLSNSLTEIGYEAVVSMANFILLKVNDPDTAVDSLDNDNISVANLSRLERLDGFLRITIGTPEQTDKLLLSLSRMAEFQATGLNRNRAAVTAKNDRIKGIKETVA